MMDFPRITLVVAMARNRVIGRGGRLPWRLPADLRHFKAVTLGKPVIMGRRTWESLGRPLPGRRNIVLSRTPGYQAPGAEVVTSLCKALLVTADAPEVMVIGGARVYERALPVADRIHLTEVLAEPEGDTRFPELPADEWREVSREHRPADADNPHACDFVVLERCKPSPALADFDCET
jgi:dihydrofolate reductase